jgi:hypothetical protein
MCLDGKAVLICCLAVSRFALLPTTFLDEVFLICALEIETW